ELRVLGRGERSPSLQVGGRYDVYRIASEEGAAKFGPATTVDFGAFSGSVGISVPLGRSASLGASVARAFRAPTVEELFSNGFHAALSSFDIGNPELGAETNTGIDAVLRVQSARVTGQLAGYHNRVD